MNKNTITINGVLYDASTGMRLGAAPAKKAEPAATTRAVTASHAIHVKTQRSATLNRAAAAKHTATTRPAATATKKPQLKSDVVRVNRPAQARPNTHPLVSKFGQPAQAATPQVKKLDKSTTLITPSTPDIAPQAHPLVKNAEAKKQAVAKKPVPATAATLSAKQIKERSLADALQKAPSHTSKDALKQHKTAKKSRGSRFMSLASASLALLVLAGYFTYINMPNISVRVAAAQAGIDASYPSYRPSGYSLSGPIAYNTGQVSMKFAATGSNQSYTITQSRSNWDSSALEQNYAQAKWGDDYSTTQSNGLTIYRKGSEAAWVNGGILYTIAGDAPLSNDQTTHLATSM